MSNFVLLILASGVRLNFKGYLVGSGIIVFRIFLTTETNQLGCSTDDQTIGLSTFYVSRVIRNSKPVII